jgi:hypothetical protein
MVAIGHNRVAWALLRSGDAQQAALEYRKTVELASALSTKAPREAQFKIDQARAGSDLSKALLRSGDLAGSAQAAKAALAVFEALPEGARAENSVRFRHGAGYYWLGQALEGRARLQGPSSAQSRTDLAEACRSYRLGLPILQEIHERFGLSDHPDDLHPDKLRKALERCPSTNS